MTQGAFATFRKYVAAAVGLSAITFALAFLAQPSEVCVGGYTTSLDGRTRSQRHNSELALSKLIGVVIQPGETFSFNDRVGSFTRDEGYRRAPVSYNGQLIDSWGGGVCQTSTTLYNAALLSGMKIVERNRHRFAPSYIPPGRDAAVAFGAIDLKFKNPLSYPVRILGTISGDRLTIGIYGRQHLALRPRVVEKVREPQEPVTYTIGVESPRARVRNSGKRGFQVAVYRLTGDSRELISTDSYPSMGRVVEYS
jgi:vancomycin resistance protein YoaR